MIAVTHKATREQTKLHNKRLILKLVYDQKLISRADVARATHLTATTVSTAIAELMSEGLVEEVGSISTVPSCPEINSSVSPSSSSFGVITFFSGR